MVNSCEAAARTTLLSLVVFHSLSSNYITLCYMLFAIFGLVDSPIFKPIYFDLIFVGSAVYIVPPFSPCF